MASIIRLNKKQVNFYFNDISEHVALVQVIDTSVNVNHAVSITGFWIYDSNYKRGLNLIK